MSRFLDPTWPERHRRELAAWIAGGSSRWSDAQRSTLDRATAVIESPEGGIAVLLGQRGTGKTLMAAALAHNARSRRESRPAETAGVKTARYWVLADLFAAERRSWVTGRTGWERISPFGVQGSPLDDAHAADLLVLDEVQERGESDWEDRELTRLIDGRYRGCRATVLVGNLQAGELATRLGASILSRVTEGGAVLTCSWPSFRVPAGVPR